jgi:hypothetical protein
MGARTLEAIEFVDAYIDMQSRDAVFRLLSRVLEENRGILIEQTDILFPFQEAATSIVVKCLFPKHRKLIHREDVFTFMQLWHGVLRSIKVEQICRFLAVTGGRWFPRSEFADYLKEHGLGYATAGRYLKALVENGILVHNGKDANQARFKLSEVFFANP